ncbi:MAG: Rrf2 family transcriptional regulator [Candidatus Latescibacterota bacterium]
MRLLRKTDYALRTLLDLTRHQDEEVVPVAAIARRQGIPPKFLEQILLTLKRAGLVTSRRGQNGGYALAVPPAQITLGAIIRLSEGESALTVWSDDQVSERPGCPFKEIWADISAYVTEKLDGATIQDVYGRMKLLEDKSGPEYMI